MKRKVQHIKLAGIVLILSILCSCTKSPDLAVASAPKTQVKLKSAQLSCNVQTASLVNEQKESGGIVTISTLTETGNILVSVTTNRGWMIKRVQIFTGNKEVLPLAGNNNPISELFPVNVTFPTTETSFSYEFVTAPTSEYQVVAVHAELKHQIRNRYAGVMEEFWIDGTPFSEKKWAMYYIYNLIPCSNEGH